MTRYMIDSIRFDDLEEALSRMESVLDDEQYRKACVAAMNALGGPSGAACMIRYLLNEEKKRLSTPR